MESISKSQSGQEREDGKEGEPKTEVEGSVDPVSDKKATSEVSECVCVSSVAS